ncbi:hypothetical protein LWC34_39635 [Kibdelosporangium philippinense]|uniref:Uncharacterized protein n=1 Tax=Kibdelosporangium philippinense TaxID=211113 RepID=A0ABS8ZM77_9PSEU|nr:hypothetical protein [Kibdelosporangium philippinense]MCE7008881.1 hypothetical protein [Kibdelosporangium philippinense]
MRRLMVSGVAMLFSVVAFAGTAVASPVKPPRCDHHFYGLGNGEGIAVLCDYGPSDRFRVIAYCEAGLSSWNEYGTIAYTGFESSDAQCRGLLATPHVAGFRIDWL